MKIKPTERKSCTGLPRAKFSKGIRKQRSAVKGTLKVKIGKFTNRKPSDSEEAPGDWHDLSPSLPSSPEVESFVECLNQECEAPAKANTPPGSPPPEATIGETLQVLEVPVSEGTQMGSPRPLPILHTPPRSPFEEGMTEDLPLPDIPSKDSQNIEATVSSTTDAVPEECSQEEHIQDEYAVPAEDTPVVSTPQVSVETVLISGTPPPVARPRFPTAAKKCPRKEFRDRATRTVKTKEPSRKPKCLTAFQEIRKLQKSFEDLIPFAPFARLVRELCHELVEMCFTKEAIQALRSSAEAYLLEILEKSNLACCHAGRCILQPKDVRLVRRVLDHDVSMGCTEEALKGYKLDFLKDRAKRVTLAEARSKEAIRHKKLRELARLRRKAYQHQANRHC